MKLITKALAACAAVILLTAASLPENGPLPTGRPPQAAAPQDKATPDVGSKAEPSVATPAAPAASDVPKPEPKPNSAGENTNPEPQKTQDQEKPKESSAPASQADKPTGAPATEAPVQQNNAEKPAGQTLEEQHNTIAAEDPAAFSECEKELRSLGAEFETISRIDDGNGCGIDKPIKLKVILPGIAMKPDAVFRCPVALALARWLKESVIPAANVAVPEQGKITTVNQASSYICRLRNSAETGKISEHARGDAIDIASFSFEKGEDIAVKPRKEDSTLPGAFQRAVSASACLYFRTVLDPESDEAHENHFHLDLLDRKGDFRYCH
ncbi:extensin-like domain-containing protein [Oryzifoliimicrobium ureilyticus]|uniref:extensin-like domain-containing protein n=1 Tax=Oryzifoliimicrobium ureilyticus TaxID=3113724 RepID=UPI0030761FF1